MFDRVLNTPLHPIQLLLQIFQLPQESAKSTVDGISNKDNYTIKRLHIFLESKFENDYVKKISTKI